MTQLANNFLVPFGYGEILHEERVGADVLMIAGDCFSTQGSRISSRLTIMHQLTFLLQNQKVWKHSPNKVYFEYPVSCWLKKTLS